MNWGRLIAGCAFAAMATGIAMVGCNAVLDNGDARYVDDASNHDAPFEDVDADGDGGDAEPRIFAGINGAECVHSAYNCRLHPDGGDHVLINGGGDDWTVTANAVLRDGTGVALGNSTDESLEFVYGQTRDFSGEAHVFAVRTSNGSPAWVLLSIVGGRDSLENKVGSVSAHREHLGRMACWQIKSTSEADIESLKFVYDATESDPTVGDYLPKIRANGKRSAGLAFNVPGTGLEGTIIDHFLAGTTFQRVQVTTQPTVGPSIDVTVWKQDGEGRYRVPLRQMTFIYGYFIDPTSDTRSVGWMAMDALTNTTTGGDFCPPVGDAGTSLSPW